MSFPSAIIERLRQSGVVAGFSVSKADQGLPVVRSLLRGGIGAIELTLRTDAGLAAIRKISSAETGMLVGVGTILTPQQVVEVKAAGADFGVSPGLNPRVIRAAKEAGLPFAPGIATPSDLERAIELGCRFVKFFPAEALGGIPYLRSMGAPYQHLGIQYFPLGGINAENMRTYLREPCVPAVGGSWIVSSTLIAAEDWEGIRQRADEVVRILKEGRMDV